MNLQLQTIHLFYLYFYSLFSVKLISSGNVLNRSQTLADQQLQNNQQVMAIVTEDISEESNAAYDKCQTAKSDAETLLKRDDSYMDVSCTHQRPLVVLFMALFFRSPFRWKIKMVISFICHQPRSGHC